MSSSVFIESNLQSADNIDYGSTSDSNLVVVYGKNGISFDDKGLENLIEEKKISSISVVRLTSPTPSMQDEEDETEKIEEMLRQQEIASDNNSHDSEDEDENLKNEESGESSDSSTDDNDGKSVNESDDSSEESKSKRRQPGRKALQSNATKQKQSLRRRRRERPEIVGLRLEEFYPPEDAKEIIKEALKMAGLTDKKTKSEQEFQLFVIQNDHCYTPYTSPSQMKAKLAADKLEAEKQAANRKITVLQTSSGKQLFIRKKIQQTMQSKGDNVPKQIVHSTSVSKDGKVVIVSQKLKKDVKDQKSISEGFPKDDSEIRSSLDENEEDSEDEDDSDLYVSDGSAESDNDRDSDLDFDVNNPKGRKRKVKLLKTQKRTLVGNKVNPKPRRSGNQDESVELLNKTIITSAAATNSSSNIVQRQKSMVKIIPDPNRTIRSTSTKIVQMMGKSNVLSPIIAALPPIPKKQGENKTIVNTTGISSSTTLQPKTVVYVKGPIETKSSLQSSPQTHKEIVINKQVMSSPKTKGFTDLTKLIEQTEKQIPVKTYALPTISKSSHTPIITSVVTFSPRCAATGALKGFMPLETAAKNQLPAQISIQTHQSSSELEAEHDKQLDLINSIVQDEMQKSNEKTEEQIINLNENIPKLVKMLESTEKVLESSNVLHTSRSDNNTSEASNRSIMGLPSANSLVGEIDITSASLLATPEEDGNDADDLPDDILQQVVDLIKDDKTLQEAVEKQVFGTSEITNNMLINQNPPPLAPISQQPVRMQENPQTSSKSIIQLAISNVPTSLAATSPSTNLSPIITTRTMITTPTTVTTTGQISKSSPLVRKEPIQIIRGNGRVITLPPIEAPTTRAKRRAQAQPNPNTSIGTGSANTSFIATTMLNESSLDSSMHSNSSMTVGSSGSVATIQDKKAADTSNRRRASKENITAAATASNQKTTKGQKAVAKKGANKSNTAKGKAEMETVAAATASEEDDDDDPNKLWCICRQPHNNRFMICCDLCEDWFHGTCVSITKAMGLEMEQKGIDWTCPKCTKKQEEKKQPKITEMLIKKPTESNFVQSEPIVVSTTLAPVLVPSVTEQKPVVPKVTTGNIEIINITSKKETSAQNLEISNPLKLQSGQIINLKDFNTTSTKRATIIQTSTSSTTPLTAGQKKLFVTSGQANLKLTSQPGTPFRTITVVKQLTTPQQHHNQNVKAIKTQSTPSASTAQNVNINTTAPLSSSLVSASSFTSSIPTSTESTTLCIVCKKNARSNSIYCSDDCIRKHAQNALNTLMNKSQTDTSSTSSPSNKTMADDKNKKKSKGLFEELLSAADRKPKVERVNVYERKSGRVITGSSAPTAANLKKWLQDNPTFEVIQPGSTQAIDLEKKQKLRTQQPSSPTILKLAVSSPPPLKMFSSASSSATKNKDTSVGILPSHGHSPQVQTKSYKNITDYLKPSHSHPASPRPSTPKQLPKYPQQVTIKPDKIPKTPEESNKSTAKEKTSATKRQTSADGSSKSSNNDGEPIRLVVRRTLKEQLLLRIKEESNSPTTSEQTEETAKINNVPELTEEEVEDFAKGTELEMYSYFNKDTGTKYKSKYRSLVFNIKDRKNRTLFAKICGKLIEPKQFVRMSPEELASQELAQWREQENKHQLEMIKKSELDLLSCAKNYVLKTHKGEEVIEGKSSDYATVDITIPVEDVVSAINKADLPDTSTTIRKESQTHWSDADSTFLSHSHSLSFIEDDKSKITSGHAKEKDKEREREREKDKDRSRGRDREKERERDKRRKSKDRHHEKVRSRKRSRSHSRSRSRERIEKRHKSSHKDEKRDREERIRTEKERSKDRFEREHSDVSERKLSSETKKSHVTQTKQPTKKLHEPQKSTINPLETYNLIDQILESTKTVEEAANLISDRDKEKENEAQRKSSITPQPIQSATSTVSACNSSSTDSAIVVDIPSSLSIIENDQEPTSTVSIPTPPHDPYSRFIACSSPSSFSGDFQYTIISLWTGNINMVDVTSFQLSLQPIVGNSTGLASLLPKELDVVGRIGPETVWDYISKIKKSPNKEIVVIRLIPASESETVAYKILYEYLNNRNRLGVIKSTFPQIKDFYIYPLGAEKKVPPLLQPNESVDFFNDPCRPDVLIGIIVRVVVSKRSINTSQTLLGSANISAGINKRSKSSNETDYFTPPGSPKPKRHRQSVTARKIGDIDVDAIIKAPIVAKAQKQIVAASVTKSHEDDADEPYSPGGSSDEDLPLLPVKLPSSMDPMQTAEDELKRKMDEINRQIAAQEMEIAGLLTGDSTTFGPSSASTSNVLANISIPSNLSQILASIKTTGKDCSTIPPPPPPLIGSLQKPLVPSASDVSQVGTTYDTKNTASGSNTNSTSLLAKLSEAELLSMVPDDIVITPNKPTRFEEPPPPGV